jgi:hypothetical protein
MVVEAYVEATTINSGSSFWFGYTPNPGSGSGVYFQFYFDGRAEVWKDGAIVGAYTASGQQKARFNRNEPKQGSSTTTGNYIGFAIIPCRGREVLVLSSLGTGFTHVFDDIQEGTANPTITPAGPFWWWVPGPPSGATQGPSVNIRCAPCQYDSTGNAYGTASKWRKEPTASPPGGFQLWVDGDTTGGTVAASVGAGACDAVTPSLAYINNTNGVRVGITLTGSTNASGYTTTPFVYAARSYTVPQDAQTPGPGVDITSFVSALDLNAADNHEGTRGTITLRDYVALAAAGVPNITVQDTRPIQIYDNGTLVFDGVMLLPKTKEGTIFSSTTPGGTSYGLPEGSNLNATITFELRDFMYFAEKYRFKEPEPLDGMTLQNALILTAQESITAHINVSGIDAFNTAGPMTPFTIPTAGAVTDGEYAAQNRETETGSEALNKLHTGFAQTSFFGYDPINGLRIAPTSELTTTPALSLYDCEATAVANAVTPSPYNLIRELDVDIIPAEANDIYAVGGDIRFKRPIVAWKPDTAAQNPTAAPGSRPINWSGLVLSYSWDSAQIATQAVANSVCELLYDRLTSIRAVVQFKCDNQPLLQRGQVVKLVFGASGMPGSIAALAGSLTGISGTIVLARIKTWNSHYQQGGNVDHAGRAMARWIPTTYTAQILDGVIDGANTHTSGFTIAEMKQEITAWAAQRRMHEFDAFKDITRRPIILWNQVM